MTAIRRAVAGCAAAALFAGCGVVTDIAGEPGAIPVRTARSGNAITVNVPGWSQPNSRAILCSRALTEAELDNLSPDWVGRVDCFALDTVQAGFELTATYSFDSASARRSNAFDPAPDWFLVLVWFAGEAQGQSHAQVRIPGGPIERP
jgi:hypothetical protein